MSNDDAKKIFKSRIYKLVLNIIDYCDKLEKDVSSRKISEQLIRSGTSMGANYFEAFSASSKKDYINYFHIALKSTNESIFWVSLLRDSSKASKDISNSLCDELKSIAKIFASSILTMKGKRSISVFIILFIIYYF